MEENTIRVESLSRGLIRRSLRLLDMEYKPREIAEELGAKPEQILRLVLAGAPARKDQSGHYWIHGLSFYEFLQKAAPKNRKAKKTFSLNQAWCMTCKSVVDFTETRRKGYIVFGTCAAGHKVSRFISLKKAEKKKGK